MTRAVFLDRDDTLITNPVDSAGEWQCYPEVQRACGELHAAGFFLVLVTNQPDLSRGLTTIREQDAGLLRASVQRWSKKSSRSLQTPQERTRRKT